MISKRGQSEIITTVLIILLVLAAIVIVWQVVQGTLRQGQTDIDKKKECLGLDIVIVKATNATSNATNSNNILIRREGTSTATGVKTQLLVNDKINASSSTVLDTVYTTTTYSVPGLAVGSQVQVAPLLSDGTACSLSEKYEVTSS